MTDLPPEIESQFASLKLNSRGWYEVQCPVHDDNEPSLGIKVDDDGWLAANCLAGCTQDAIFAALNWTPRNLHGTQTGSKDIVYPYRDVDGAVLYEVVRKPNKQFRQRVPQPDGTYSYTVKGVKRIPYRFPELLDALDHGTTVYIAEGEKDVHSLVDHGKVATCNAGGAGTNKWDPNWAQWFEGANVIICADKDEPGRKHARQIGVSLEPVAASVWIVEAAGAHKDITDHLEAGLTFADLMVTNRSDQPIKPDLALDVYDLITSPDADYDWLIEGLLERRDRMILTGFEGLGKSFLMRQLAVCCALGVNPITFRPMEPLKVLMIDAENTERQNRRAYKRIVGAVERAGRTRLQRGRFNIEMIPNGKDLPNLDGEDAAWLIERFTAHKADIVFLGPLYNMHMESANDEKVVRRLTQAINLARVSTDCAVIMEAHAGHGGNGTDVTNRSVRPFGSSFFLRWPEFGYGIRNTFDAEKAEVEGFVDMMPWRGPRDERMWPEYWQRNPDVEGVPWLPYLDRQTAEQAARRTFA